MVCARHPVAARCWARLAAVVVRAGAVVGLSAPTLYWRALLCRIANPAAARGPAQPPRLHGTRVHAASGEGASGRDPPPQARATIAARTPDGRAGPPGRGHGLGPAPAAVDK